MKRIVLFIGIILSLFSFAQDPNFEWVSGAYGTGNFDFGNAIITDGSGNSYVTGQFESTVDFDPGPGTILLTSAGSQDIFISKYNNIGALVWVKTLGNTGSDKGSSIEIDNNGNTIITGTFSGTVDFDPGVGINTMTAVSVDAFILKLNSSGDFIWAKQFAGTVATNPKTIKIDGNGNIYIGGSYSSTTDFDPGVSAFNLTSLGGNDAFCAKLTPTGDLTWAVAFGGTGTDQVIGLSIDASSNVYLTGNFEGSVDFDPSASTANRTSQGSSDIFIQKLNSNGGLVWIKTVGGTGMELSGSNMLNSNNDILVTGSFQNTVDFDPNAGVVNLTTIGFSAGFILNLSTDGNLNWVQQNEGSSPGISVSCYALTLDDFDRIYVTGSFDGSVDFDPSAGTFLLSQSGTAGFIQKLAANGDFIWAGKLAPSTVSITEGLAIDITTEGKIHVTGAFRVVTDFDPGIPVNSLTSAGGYDIYNLRLNQCEYEINHDTPSLPDFLSECSITSITPPTASNCMGTYTGVPDISFPITNSGITVITWAYTNSLGFTSTQTQNVIIDDVTAPVPNIASLTNVNAECSVANLTAPTATDNCSGTITGTHNASLPITTQGTTVVTWTYNDGNGNTSTQTQNVVIDDVTAPVPNIASLLTVNAECSVTVLTAPTATDNCAGTITGTHNASLPITTQGTTVVTWTYNDGNGNTFTQTQNVIIDDLTAPVPNTASLSTVNAECSVTSLTAPTATDNCAGTITGTHNASLPITTQGTTVVTWTYNDGNGNTSTQTQNVIIDDVTAPVPNIASLTNVNAECSVTSLTAPTATDNCAGTITGIHNATLPISTQGTTVVTWTYNDGNGNTSTQTQNVIIDDETAPVPNNASLVSVNAECSVTSLTAPTATDNCAGTITGTHNATLPISTQGTTIVTWTYDDGNGNISTQTQNVVIDDVIAPFPNNASLASVNAECSVTTLTAPIATDNCVGMITGTHNASLPITTQGTTIVTWTYDDGNGNTSTQTQNVVLNDVSAPVPNVAAIPDVSVECSVTSLIAPTATDNCAGTIIGTHNATLPITTQGTTLVTWTYDDGNGNISIQTQYVDINDVTPPVANATNLSDITSECEVTSLSAPTATDNCAGTINGTHNAVLPITTQGTTVVTWTYNDGNGNTSTQMQNVIINDLTPPVANTANLSDIISECSVTSLTYPTATDNCAGTITGTHNATLPISSEGTTVVTWTYDDGNGNTSTQTQNVIITPIDNGITQVNAVTLSADATGYNYQWIDCDNGNQPINGATNQTFTAIANGNYAVEIDNGTCTVVSACMVIDEVGINEIWDTDLVEIYPNPTTGTLNIESTVDIQSIELMDALGQLIKIYNANENIIEINTAPGVYFLRITAGGIENIIRVVKQ